MPQRIRRVWLDNLIYLGAGLAAAAIVFILAALKIPFPRRGISVAITMLFLGGNLLSGCRKSWRSARFWTLLTALMVLHVVFLLFVLDRGLPVVLAFFLMAPEFVAMSAIIRWTTASTTVD
jgi:hypothetical protein